MTNRTVTCAVTIAALACAGSLRAHHSIGMFDISTPIWVKGTVTRYEPVNPHIMIALEERKEDGQVQRWTVEGPSVTRLARNQIDENLLQVGDTIEVCGFGFKEDVLTRLASGDAGRLSLPAVHAHLLVMADGRMQPWGSYGKLDNCIRPDDQPQSWLDFVNTDPMAREYWCRSRTLVNIASIAPKTFVEEIYRRMANPCD